MPDYRLDILSPSDILTRGIQTATGISGILEQGRQRQAATQRQEQINTAMAEFNAVENPSFEDYRKAFNVLPKDQADSLRSTFELESKEEQANQLKFAGQVMAAFDASPEIGARLLNERAEAENDEEKTKAYKVWAEIAEKDPDTVKRTMGIMVSALPGGDKILEGIGRLEKRKKVSQEKPFAPVTLVNPKTGEKIPHIPTFDPNTGKARLEPAELPEGFELSKETPKEKRQADVAIAAEKKGAEITGKGQAERRQITINRGVDSSEGLANLKRARTLLEEVKTGGINAASLRAKQIFGVEGADEGELSNRLGKAVLSQLRETFGAAFTAQEGASLARIEAGFGKSAKANKRLIDQLIKMVEKKGKQGIAAAVAAEDFEAAQLIKDNLAFSLDIETPTAQRLKYNPTTGKIE